MNGTPRVRAPHESRAGGHAHRPAPPRSRPAACGPVGDETRRRFGLSSRPQSACHAVQVSACLPGPDARRHAGKMTHGAAPHVVGLRENTRAKTVVAPMHQRRRGAKLRRSSSGCSRIAPRPAPRTVENRPPRRCEIRRWTAWDRPPGTACGHRPPTSPA
jgi:hypothetical protein